MLDDTVWYEKAVERIGGSEPFRWFLAQLKPNCLTIAKKNLDRQGFRSFAPMLMETRRSGPRFKTEPRPMFPGYVFVSLDTSKGHWRSVNSTYGVTKLVAFGGMPAPLPHGLVEQLALRCDGNGLVSPPEELAPGDRVLVTSGPFTGVWAEVERTSSERRVWVLLDIMGQRVRIDVDREWMKRG